MKRLRAFFHRATVWLFGNGDRTPKPRRPTRTLSTLLADGLEWALCWLARRNVAMLEGYQSYRLAYRDSLRTTPLRMRDYEIELEAREAGFKT